VAASLDDELETSSEAEGLASFVGGMLAEKAAASPQAGEEPEICPECGFSSDDLESRGVLGCPACYTAFRTPILQLLERYHRGTTHAGKTPRVDGPRAALRRELADLRTALERSVASERYEEAARLRDRIRERERELATLAAAGSESGEGPQGATNR